jgi:hypothetical protein
VADLPFQLAGPLAERLAVVADVEGKLVRTLDSLGALAGRDVVLLDAPASGIAGRLRAATGASAVALPLTTPLRLELPDGSADAVVSLWSGFRGITALELDEVDRVLRTDGRLLVVHDYGRDDVSGLRDPEAPEYRSWSRREGPFLRDGGFKLRVVHCFWTFSSVEDAGGFLGEAFGERGLAVAGRLRRPRLTWNVAIYHRTRAAAPGSAGAAVPRPGRSPTSAPSASA